MQDYIRAGKIAAESLSLGRSLIKPDILLLDVAEKIESKVKSLGGKLAFPVNISINEIAAHYSPFPNDKTEFSKNDLVKLDIGVHINGKIADTATTIDLGNNKELVKASEQALKAAIKLSIPGTKVSEIGSAIESEITSLGFKPIKNLSGHLVDEYELHAGLTIPNYNNQDSATLKENQVIAIEPFATSGIGSVEDGKLSGIYRLVKIKPTRIQSVRNVLNFITKEYQTLPFSIRSLSFPNTKFALRILERDEIIMEYKQLIEKSKSLVSQAEHTVIVQDTPKVITQPI